MGEADTVLAVALDVDELLGRGEILIIDRIEEAPVELSGRVLRESSAVMPGSNPQSDGRSLGVLMTLANHGSLTQQQLGQLLGIDRTTMVDVVDALEADGRIVRHRRPPDRRGNQVTITDAGKTVLHKADGALQQCEDEFIAGLSATDRSTLMRLLHKLPRQDVLLRPARTRSPHSP